MSKLSKLPRVARRRQRGRYTGPPRIPELERNVSPPLERNPLPRIPLPPLGLPDEESEVEQRKPRRKFRGRSMYDEPIG